MLPGQRRSSGVVVGVDAGGTWVRVRARAGARRLAALTRPASAVPELATFLHSLWRRRGWSRARVRALVVAARGVWLPRERRALGRRLAGLAVRVSVVADVEAAWHATLDGERGVLVLAGTGSIALGRDARRRWARAGGLGPLPGAARARAAASARVGGGRGPSPSTPPCAWRGRSPRADDERRGRPRRHRVPARARGRRAAGRARRAC